MSCQCGGGSPKPNNEDVINYAPLGEAFKDNKGISNYTKFEKLLIIVMLLLCFFLYQEIKV